PTRSTSCFPTKQCAAACPMLLTALQAWAAAQQRALRMRFLPFSAQRRIRKMPPMREPHFWYPVSRNHLGIAARLLAPAGFLYGAAGGLKRRLVKPVQSALPVICIGNITSGGAGKTPVAMTIASLLLSQGERVHFLSRGYGGRERGPIRVDPFHHGARDVGDEPLLLATVASTWVAADRPKGAAAAERGGAGLIIMDDGFQNPSLNKDFSILVVDAAVGLGNGRLI